MGFMDDRRGFYLSLDLLIALIPLTILMGMMVTDMDNMFYTLQSTVYQSSLDRVGTDAVNTLIKTSGSPYNWEQTGDLSVVGLAKYDNKKQMPVQNYLSAAKLSALQPAYIQNLTGPGYAFYLNITTVDTNRNVKTVGTPYNSSTPNVARIERLVIASNIDLITSLEGLIRDAGQPRTYSTTFPTNDESIASNDYWVLVINRGYDSATVTVNNNRVVRPQDINQHITELKRQVNDTFMKNASYFQDNTVDVRTVSNPGASMDVYIIAAPKGTPESEINLENIQPRQCRFIFYIWTI